MPERILIVDDDEKILKLFDTVLTRAGFEVRTAASGMEALRVFQTERFDLIILDLRMPGMDGIETLRGIRGRDPAVPVYVVTAFKNEFRDGLLEMQQAGIAFELLSKPVEKAQLLRAVESVFKGPVKG